MEIGLVKEKPSLYKVRTTLHAGIYWTKWRWVSITELATMIAWEVRNLLYEFIEFETPRLRGQNRGEFHVIVEVNDLREGGVEYDLRMVYGRRGLLDAPWKDGGRNVSPLEYFCHRRTFVPAGWALAVLEEVERRKFKAGSSRQ